MIEVLAVIEFLMLSISASISIINDKHFTDAMLKNGSQKGAHAQSKNDRGFFTPPMNHPVIPSPDNRVFLPPSFLTCDISCARAVKCGIRRGFQSRPH